ncbi:hypothetical protein [Nocardia pseudovaccinii]|uniref:hypothetical protein n=1 Tax=Nocardia pseudovaccinii TaxID=189540 RepID=UPI0007A4A630|nr:hypothetical protein [Nocardia pseudovaccinii]
MPENSTARADLITTLADALADRRQDDGSVRHLIRIDGWLDLAALADTILATHELGEYLQRLGYVLVKEQAHPTNPNGRTRTTYGVVWTDRAIVESVREFETRRNEDNGRFATLRIGQLIGDRDE